MCFALLLIDSKSLARPANFRTAISTLGNLVSRSAKYKAALQDEDEQFGDDEGSGVSPSEKPSPIIKLVSAVSSCFIKVKKSRLIHFKTISKFISLCLDSSGHFTSHRRTEGGQRKTKPW